MTDYGDAFLTIFSDVFSDSRTFRNYVNNLVVWKIVKITRFMKLIFFYNWLSIRIFFKTDRLQMVDKRV